MAWQGILGHDAIVERFRRVLSQNRLASSFLFVGPSGIGKRAFALRLAKSLLCGQRAADEIDPCNHCDNCRQADLGTHPDLIVIEKPADKTELPLSLFIGDREHRMQQGLCHDISLTPYMARRKVAIIDDADALGEEAANCLLKTLEEPPLGSVLILIGSSAERQLPTIRSRSQIIRFSPPTPDDAATLIAQQLGVTDPGEALRLAGYAEGSLVRATELRLPELWEFRRRLLRGLSELPAGSVVLANDVIAFVESAGKESQPRRARLRQVIDFAAGFYRHVIHRLCDAPLGDSGGADAEVEKSAEHLLTARKEWDDQTAAACLERCLDALIHVDRNAHLSTTTECWIDDVSRLTAGEWLSRVGAG
ncbi:MAG: DNA polymerase III subunit [Planctomycetia bacterium]|nr:DNA polymerase III subunit [Planctomycetia bacterium]